VSFEGGSGTEGRTRFGDEVTAASAARSSGRMRRGLPRAAEAVVAAVGLLVSLPLLAVAAVVVRSTSRGPVLFRQRRMGRGGRPFVLLKLRTMRHLAEGAAVTVAGDARVTPVGRWLRWAKVDELPELWNVLRGDMALVGPRPEVPELVDTDDSQWRAVLAVRPGITDPVTLSLRHEEALLAGVDGDRDEYYRRVLQPYKLCGYLEYLGRRSVWTDLGVLARTVWAVAAPGSVSPPTREEIAGPESEPHPPGV
jgi:lipopolysaccharide/colanic/teichoic acid biosynthesis glycosyltransferase